MVSTVSWSSRATTAPPASAITRAFWPWSSSRATARGTSMAGRPAMANSQTDPAPDRPITRWAAFSRLAMSRKKGAISAFTLASA